MQGRLWIMRDELCHTRFGISVSDPFCPCLQLTISALWIIQSLFEIMKCKRLFENTPGISLFHRVRWGGAQLERALLCNEVDDIEARLHNPNEQSAKEMELHRELVGKNTSEMEIWEKLPREALVAREQGLGKFMLFYLHLVCNRNNSASRLSTLSVLLAL